MAEVVKKQAAELGRFLVVGLSAVATDFAVYFALSALTPTPTSVAKAVSFAAGAFVSFVLNRGFVFRADGAAKQQAIPFTILYLVTLALNNGVNALVLSWGFSRFIGWFVATGASTVGNFLGMKFVVFRAKKRVEISS
ncbi:MAG: GtrA family protein [Polyangiaceae bacterium]